MESTNQIAAMLELLAGPAFLVCDGTVRQVNSAAQAYLVEPGQSVAGWITAGSEEYSRFTDGCLYLQLRLPTGDFGASVTAVEGGRLFLLDAPCDPQLQVLALAATELRQPLAGIMALANKVFPALAQDAPPTTREQLSAINQNLYQLLRIIGNMSDANRFASEGSQNLEIRDLRDVLTEIFEKAEAYCSFAGIKLETPEVPDCGNCAVDADLLERAVFNLVSNAVKYRSQEPVIQIIAKRLQDKLVLTFRDNGCGFAANTQATLCSRYLRRPDIEDGRNGIGLGLVLVRSAAAAHGGTVLFQREDGFTRITMTLSLSAKIDTAVRSPLHIDYAGEFSHALLEFSEFLPPDFYSPQ